MAGSQSNEDALEELLNLKMMIFMGVVLIPPLVVAMSTSAARWCLEHGVVVSKDQAVVVLPWVTPAVGLDVVRIVLGVLGVLILVMGGVQSAVWSRRARIRRVLKEANRL